MKQWYGSFEKLEPVDTNIVESVRGFVPTRREFLTGLAIQGIVLSIGKGEIDKRGKSVLSRGAQSTLESYIPDILVAEPDWDYFAEDFTLIDQLGVTVTGLEANKRLLKIVRNLRDGLFMTPLKADFDADTERTSFMIEGQVEPVLIAMWNLTIDLRARIPYDLLTTIESQTLANIKVSNLPITFAGNSCFRFNADGKVSQMKIDTWSINGRQVKLPLLSFPDVKPKNIFDKPRWTTKVVESYERLSEDKSRLAEVGDEVQLDNGTAFLKIEEFIRSQDGDAAQLRD
jgi:hypothetical protein